jgi:hypothetical protein
MDESVGKAGEGSRPRDGRPWPPGMAPEPGARVIDSGLLRTWRDHDGIIYSQNLVDGVVDRSHLESAFDGIGELTQGRRAVIVAYGSMVTAVTREAREYMVGPAAEATIAAVGVVITSPVVRIVMTFFMRLSSPPYAVKFLSSVEEGRTWARGFLERRASA